MDEKRVPGLPRLYDGMEMKNISPRDVQDTAFGYIANWDRMKRNGTGLVFFGPVGAGKTGAAVSIANSVFITSMVHFLPVEDLKRELQAQDQRNTSDESRLEDAMDADLLIVDGLCGGGKGFAPVEGRVVDFLLTRISEHTPLILTVDVERPGDVKAEVGKWYGPHLFPKLVLHCHAVPMSDPTWRLARGREMRKSILGGEGV